MNETRKCGRPRNIIVPIPSSSAVLTEVNFNQCSNESECVEHDNILDVPPKSLCKNGRPDKFLSTYKGKTP